MLWLMCSVTPIFPFQSSSLTYAACVQFFSLCEILVGLMLSTSLDQNAKAKIVAIGLRAKGGVCHPSITALKQVSVWPRLVSHLFKELSFYLFNFLMLSVSRALNISVCSIIRQSLYFKKCGKHARSQPGSSFNADNINPRFNTA